MNEFTNKDAKIGYILIALSSVTFGLWQKDVFSGIFIFLLLSAIIFIMDDFKNG